MAGLTAEDAKAQLIDSLKQEAHTKAIAIQQEIIEEAKLKAGKEARKIVIQTIQRTAAEVAIENCPPFIRTEKPSTRLSNARITRAFFFRAISR